MDKVNIGESTLKDFGDVINEAADILNKGKVAFDNSIPDKTLQVLPYTGQAGAIIPSKIGDLADLTTTAKDNLVNAINEVNDSLSSNTNVVTIDTEQTITGNKFFQADENANNFIRFYPTPTRIDGSSSEYIAHAAGYVLVGKDGTDYNTHNLIFDIPTQRSVIFTNSSGGNIGSVGCESATSSQGFRMSYNTNLLNHSFNCITGSFFCDLVWDKVYPSKGLSFMGLGQITDGNNECGAFIATPYNLHITLLDSTSELVLNDKAKSEFQRVLSIAKIDDTNTFLTNQTFDGVCTFNATALFEQVSIRELQISGSCNLGMDVKSMNYHLNNLRKGKDLKINGTEDGIELNLGDTAILTMNARMISELKRLLGIQ